MEFLFQSFTTAIVSSAVAMTVDFIIPYNNGLENMSMLPKFLIALGQLVFSSGVCLVFLGAMVGPFAPWVTVPACITIGAFSRNAMAIIHNTTMQTLFGF